MLKIRRQEPVTTYLKMQKRFAHLFGKRGDPEILARIQAIADRNIAKYGLLEGEEADDVPVPEQAAERAHLV